MVEAPEDQGRVGIPINTMIMTIIFVICEGDHKYTSS